MLALILALAASARAIEIHPHPIVTEKRLELTRRYCKRHYGLDSSRLEAPQVVVVHATEMRTLKASLTAFEPDTLSPSRAEIAGHGEVNVGAHFLVDQDGTVYSLLPLDVIGRHAIGLNHVSIGIENVGSEADLTPEQAKSDAELIEDLVKRLPSLRYLIGHHEYARKDLPHHALFKELDRTYPPTKKSDPGKGFMSRLRAALAASGVRLAD